MYANKKVVETLLDFQKKIQLYNCQIYGIALLTPKAKTNPLGKVSTDRRKYFERAEISETASLITLETHYSQSSFPLLCEGTTSKIPTPISAPCIFYFFFVIS